jgi:hypothetical protein
VAARSETAADASLGRSQRERALAFLVSGLHLTVLTSFALAQPLFDLLGKNAEFFAARDSPPSEIVAFALVVTFALPFGVLVVELLGNLIHPAGRTGVHLAAVGFLTAVIILHAAANATAAAAALLIPVAVVGGAAFAFAYCRARPVRSFLTILAPAPFVFLGLFLFTGQVAKLVTPNEATAATVAVHARTPVVVVIFDEFPVVSLMDRRERLDSARYPKFASFARDSIWFRNATAVSDYTTWAAPAILGGEYPAHDRLPIASDHPHSVFTLLGGSYDISAFLPFPQLCPQGLCKKGEPEPGAKERVRSLVSDVSVVYGHLLLPEDLRTKLPSVEGTWKDFRGEEKEPPPDRGKLIGQGKKRSQIGAALLASLDERARTFEEFIASLNRSQTPTLRVLHVLYPHAPWDRLPSGRYYNPRPRVLGTRRSPGPEFLVRQSWQRHLLQVGFTDQLVGEVVRRLKEIGAYDRSLIVFTADHGASFRLGHGFRQYEEANAPDILFVPLFVKLPHQERGGTIVDSHVQTIDVVPTIADVLNIRLPWRLDGRSLLQGGTDRVRLLDKHGTLHTGQIEGFEAGRRELVELQAQLFGNGKDRPGLFGIGPNRELVGQSPSRLPAAPASGMKAELDRASDLRSVNPDSAYVPALITGRISSGSGAGPFDLAISLNGTIVAVAASFRREGEDVDRFSFVVPESAFRPGANEARIYRVVEAGGGLTLAQMACVGC